MANESKKFPKDKIKTISILSSWGELKNPISAIRAFKILRDKYGTKLEYHLFGYGFKDNGCGYYWAKKNNLLDGLFFHGYKLYDEMMSILPNYDIVLYPAKEESFGMTLIEAMAKGFPVVAGKDSGAVPWVLENGKYGILVNIKSSEEIASGIESILLNKEKYIKISEKV